MEEKIKWLLSIIMGGLTTFTRQYGLMIVFVIIAIVTDVITGIIKAKATGEPLESKKGTKGFFKKMALLVALFFGFFLDYALPYFMSQIHVDVNYNMPFALIIAFYICLNEAISIAENLYATNPSIMPKWIVNILTNAKDKIDNEEIEE